MSTTSSTAQLTKDQEAAASAEGAPTESQGPPPLYPDQENPAPNYGTTDTVPPSYAQAQSEAPPSYDSLYGQIKAKKRESSGFVDFMKKVVVLLLGTLGCTICVGIVLAIPISMIVIGSLYVKDCTYERFIPIYLIVAGVFGVLKNLSNMLQRLKNRREDNDEENAKTNPVDGIISCFLFGWFIAGNVWIYRIYSTVNTQNSQHPHYCHPTLYYFAFWMTTATYILIGLTCCCVCCAGVAGAAMGEEEEN